MAFRKTNHLKCFFFVCVILLFLLFSVSAAPATEQPYEFKVRMASVKLEQCYKKLDEVGCEEFVIKNAKDIIKGLPECFEAYYLLGGAYCKELKKAYLLLGEDHKPEYFKYLNLAKENFKKALKIENKPSKYRGLGPSSWLKRIEWHINFWETHTLYNFSEYGTIRDRPIIDEFYETKPYLGAFPYGDS